jgi:uncharacterized protein
VAGSPAEPHPCGTALAQPELMLDHMGADRAFGRLSNCGFMWVQLMLLSYDPSKSARNEAERGLAFDLAEEFDWSSALIAEDRRRDYEERRYQALGSIGEHLHMLVFTPRGGAIHVISLRRANQRERMRYARQTRP